MKRWRIAGINFDHFHMGDLLRQVFDHPNADIVAICDEHPGRMLGARQNFGLSDAQVFTDHIACLEQTKPDLVILCPAASAHGEWVEKVAPYGVHVLMEKPFAGTLAEADSMIAAMAPTGKKLIVNWPLVWIACQQTASFRKASSVRSPASTITAAIAARSTMAPTRSTTNPPPPKKPQAGSTAPRSVAAPCSTTWAMAPPSAPGTSAAALLSR